jgi:Ulp1 family protease
LYGARIIANDQINENPNGDNLESGNDVETVRIPFGNGSTLEVSVFDVSRISPDDQIALVPWQDEQQEDKDGEDLLKALNMTRVESEYYESTNRLFRNSRDRHRCPILYQHYERLQPNGHIHQCILEWALGFISRSDRKTPDGGPFHVFSQDFIKMMLEGRSVDHFTHSKRKNIDVLSKKAIFFPVVYLDHHFLVVVVNPGKMGVLVVENNCSQCKLPLTRGFVLDSIPGNPAFHDPIVEGIRKWLRCQHRKKNNNKKVALNIPFEYPEGMYAELITRFFANCSPLDSMNLSVLFLLL